MAKIISTHSFRGGAGKSNTTANLAVLVAKAGFRVGIIDTDIQSRGVHVLFQLKDVFPKSLNDFLWGRCRIEEVAFDVTERSIGRILAGDERPRLFLIPSSLKISEVASMIREGYEAKLLSDGLHDLARRLRLDYVLIDTHSGINEETLLPIAISDQLIFIMRPDQSDIDGTAIAIALAKKLEVPRISVVINKVPADINTESTRDQVQNLLKADVAAVLPFTTEMVSETTGTLFCNRHPGHPLTQQLEILAKRVLQP